MEQSKSNFLCLSGNKINYTGVSSQPPQFRLRSLLIESCEPDGDGPAPAALRHPVCSRAAPQSPARHGQRACVGHVLHQRVETSAPTRRLRRRPSPCARGRHAAGSASRAVPAAARRWFCSGGPCRLTEAPWPEDGGDLAGGWAGGRHGAAIDGGGAVVMTRAAGGCASDVAPPGTPVTLCRPLTRTAPAPRHTLRRPAPRHTWRTARCTPRPRASWAGGASTRPPFRVLRALPTPRRPNVSAAPATPASRIGERSMG